MSAASSTMTLTPTLAKCRVAGIGASAKINGCTYVLHSTNEAAPYAGTFDISCPSGSTIEFDALNDCTVQVPAQSALANVEFANTGTSGSGRTITMTLNVSGLKSTQVGTECPSPNGTTALNGTLTSTTLIKGSDGEYAVGVYLGNEQSGETPLHSFQGEEFPLVVQAVEPQGYPAKITVPIYSTTSCELMTGKSLLSAAGGALTQGIQKMEKCSNSVGTVSMNGCYFVLNHASSEVPGPTVGIACGEAGASITYLAAGACTIKIPAQGGGPSFSVENKGTGSSRYMRITWWMSGLKYVEACTGKSLVGASISGTWDVKGYQYEGLEAGGLPKAGAQKGIWST